MSKIDFILEGEKLIFECMKRIDEGDREFKEISEYLKQLEERNGRSLILSFVYRTLSKPDESETFLSLFNQEQFIRNNSYRNISKDNLREKLKRLDLEFVVLEKTIQIALEYIESWQKSLQNNKYENFEVEEFFKRYGEENDTRDNYKKYLHDRSLLE